MSAEYLFFRHVTTCEDSFWYLSMSTPVIIRTGPEHVIQFRDVRLHHLARCATVDFLLRIP